MNKTSQTYLLYLLILFLGRSYACDCLDILSPSEGFNRYSLVVSGKIISIDTLTNQEEYAHFGSFEQVKYTLLVKSNYKGEVSGDTLFIYTPVAESACGYPFELNQQYIVFGYNRFRNTKTHQSQKLAPNHYFTNLCTPNQPYSWRLAVKLKQITRRAARAKTSPS